MKFSITTLGCKVNQYDSAAISAALRRAGLVSAPGVPGADLTVVNTCCVTIAAMRKSRQAIRRAVKRSPATAVLVTGCYCHYDAGRIAQLLVSLNVPPERAAVVAHHGALAECIERLVCGLTSRSAGDSPRFPGRQVNGNRRQAGWQPGSDEECMSAYCFSPAGLSETASIRTCRQAAVKSKVAPSSLGPIDRFDGHQRAFVKVQEGCDAFCTYCIVPYTRPQVRSRGVEEILRECRVLVAAGHREIVLCGVFLGAYGWDTTVRRRRRGRSGRLAELIRRVAGIEGLWRVRLSSLDPGALTDGLLAACRRLPNFAPHFHLSLQSGSDRILRRMNRQYTAEDYRQAVDRVREAFDRPAITTDIIVGFPSETDADFAETVAMARYAGFAKIHTFPFSAIRGTAAWEYRSQAPPRQLVRSRAAELTQLERRLAMDYRRRFVGEVLEGLIENGRSPRLNVRRAMTDRYVKASFRVDASTSTEISPGSVVAVRVERGDAPGLFGKLVKVLH